MPCQAEREPIAMRRCRGTPEGEAPVAQLDRAPDYESGGREFESLRARQYFQEFSENRPRTGTPALRDRTCWSASSLCDQSTDRSRQVSTINVAIVPARFTASCAWRGDT